MPRRTSTALLLAALSIVLWAAPAQGSTVFGADLLSGTPSFGTGCSVAPCAQTQTIQSLAPSHRAPGGFAAPSAGVIVGWSLHHGPIEADGGGPGSTSFLNVNLRVIRGAGATGVGAGSGPTEDLPQAAGTYSFAARLPVRAGDLIGYDVHFGPATVSIRETGVATGAVPEDVIGASAGATWPEGGVPPLYTSTSKLDPAYLLMNATLEPDADGDGFGDETQDGCPAQSTTQGTCAATAGPPAPADTVPPETKISKAPPKHTEKTKAKFVFGSSEPGSSFECALKGRGLDRLLKQFNECRSPRKYRKLEPGAYKFLVRATDAAGNVDPTPAKARFTVVASGD
jgi:hypothetical protein